MKNRFHKLLVNPYFPFIFSGFLILTYIVAIVVTVLFEMYVE